MECSPLRASTVRLALGRISAKSKNDQGSLLSTEPTGVSHTRGGLLPHGHHPLLPTATLLDHYGA